ncbi:MAG: helix-turn-helix domain-containing protein [Eubacterium sp.]|nr:helix-turn-helix domain-containing protein [Eubacterium sp.]
MFDSYADVVTVEEMAKMLRIGKNQTYSLVKSGTIYSIRIGKKYLIPKKNIIAYLEGFALKPIKDNDIMDESCGLVINKEGLS